MVQTTVGRKQTRESKRGSRGEKQVHDGPAAGGAKGADVLEKLG